MRQVNNTLTGGLLLAALAGCTLYMLESCASKLPPMPQPYVFNRFRKADTQTANKEQVQPVIQAAMPYVATGVTTSTAASEATAVPGERWMIHGTSPAVIGHRRYTTAVNGVVMSIRNLKAFSSSRASFHQRQFTAFLNGLNPSGIDYADTGKLNRVIDRLTAMKKTIDKERVNGNRATMRAGGIPPKKK